MDDVSDIRRYYDHFPEEDARLDHNQLERDLTWRYLDDYLPPPPGPLLELGAATGRYTRELARRGYSVTAADLSPALTTINREKCREAGLGGQVEHIVADARDLSLLRGRTFAAALVMGPLYHLIEESDRRQVLRQVRGLLEPGGLIVSAFISRLGIWGHMIIEFPWMVTKTPDEVDSILLQGRGLPQAPRDGDFRGYYARVEEIGPLHESEGFSTLAVAASEPAISADDESYNRLEGEQRRAWIEFLYHISREPSIAGASRHLLYIGRRSE